MWYLERVLTGEWQCCGETYVSSTEIYDKDELETVEVSTAIST